MYIITVFHKYINKSTSKSTTMSMINRLDLDPISIMKTLVSFVYDIISWATLSILQQQTSQTWVLVILGVIQFPFPQNVLPNGSSSDLYSVKIFTITLGNSSSCTSWLSQRCVHLPFTNSLTHDLPRFHHWYFWLSLNHKVSNLPNRQ